MEKELIYKSRSFSSCILAAYKLLSENMKSIIRSTWLPVVLLGLFGGVCMALNVHNERIIQAGIAHTGIYIALPEGYECQIRPRSGLALKRGLTVLNTPGTIDADYRGEVCVILVNLSNEAQTIEDGERICQLVVARHETVTWVAVDDLDSTERGAGGFGHTGNQ